MTFLNSGIFGFDISTYQDASTTSKVVDFNKMKAYGASFVIIKIGQGNWIDQDWVTHKNNSLGILPRSGYWYYDPRYDPVVQAQTCLSGINGSGIKRLWIDLEFTWDGSYKLPQHWKQFRDIISAAGYKTGVYTRKTWWDTRVGSYAAYFAQDPCWVAQYNTSLTLIPLGWSDAMIWQSGTPSIGIDAGVESAEIDYNVWNGNFNFEAEWGTSTPPPPDGGNMHYFELMSNVIGEYRSIRAAHLSSHIQGSKIGQLNAGQVAKSDADVAANRYEYTSSVVVSGITYAQAGDVWWRIYEANGTPIDGWIAEIHLGKRYLNMPKEVGAPPPPPPPPADSVFVTVDVEVSVNGKLYGVIAQNLEALPK